MYTAEVSHPDIRGATSAFYSVLLSSGLLFGFTLGYVLEDWRLISGLMAVPSAILFIMSLFVPNSPYWLVEEGRNEEAKVALKRLRGGHSDYEAELETIVEKKRSKDAEAKVREGENCGTAMGVLNRLTTTSFLIPFAKIAFLMILTEIAGMNVLAQYMVIIFEESGSSIEPRLAPIIVAGMRVMLACISTLILRYSPRKPLFLLSCLLIFLSYIAMGTFNLFKTKARVEIEVASESPYAEFLSAWGWVPLACLMVIQAAQTIGFLTVIHFNLQAESFSTENRALGCGLLGAVTSLSRFASTKLYPQMIELMGFFGIFYFFAGVVALIAIYALIIMPENKGQALTTTESKMQK